MDNILKYSATELSGKIRNGELKVVDGLGAVFKEIENRDLKLNCYITLDKEGAYKKAEIIQKMIDEGKLNTAIAGVPFAVKDNICTKGMVTTCGSKMLEKFVPTYSAEVINRLEEAGAIVIGKTNMDEFAMGSTSETSIYGSVKNPHNVEHVAGGSSGGSAAALAANECFFALGSDTGGSVRQPASHCGVLGLKPTYSRVSRYGLIAYASSMDQIGPFCKSVEDMAVIMDIISGYDSKDSTSSMCDNQFLKYLNEDIKGIRIGVPKEYIQNGISKDVKESVLKAIQQFKEMGANIEVFEMRLSDYIVPAYYTIASAEASSNLERYDGIKYGYRTEKYSDLHNLYKRTRSEGLGQEVKKRIRIGSFVLSEGYYNEYFLKALRIRRLLKEEYDASFEKYDAILGPVSPTTAPQIGMSLNSPIEMYLSDIYTVGANLIGLPAISIPYGKDSKGLPIGIQLTANRFREDKLFNIAYALEKAGGILYA